MSSNNSEIQERRCDLILRFMKLEEIANNHLHPDEVAGDYYVIPKEELDNILLKLRVKVREISEEIRMDSHSGKALKTLIEIWEGFNEKHMLI